MGDERPQEELDCLGSAVLARIKCIDVKNAVIPRLGKADITRRELSKLSPAPARDI